MSLDPGPLRRVVQGAVLTPADPGFASALASFNSQVPHRPELAVCVQNEAEVVAAIEFARAHRRVVTVHGGGHGAHVPIMGGVTLVTSGLSHVKVEPARALAHFGAGVRWSAVAEAAAPHGLAAITGSSPTVGAVGYLLAGGLGPLARSHGFSSDFVTAYRVVTGTGEALTARADTNAELFWALRGGKYGVGVVVAASLRLVALPPVFGGHLLFEAPHLERVLQGWLAWTATADARVTTSVVLLQFPPVEAVPPHLRGKRVLGLRFAFPGPRAEGERLLAPLRALAPAFHDGIGLLAPNELGRIHDDPTEPSPFMHRGTLLARADAALGEALLAAHAGPIAMLELRHLGAATTRDVPEGSAVSGRGAAYAVGFATMEPSAFAGFPAMAQALLDSLRPWRSAEENLNFFGQPHSADELAAAWPAATRARLESIRRRCDPDGVLDSGLR